MIKRLSLALMIGALGGCTGLGTLKQASKPNDLYLLTPKSTFSSSLPRISKQIVVEEPTATAAVNTDQIAVTVIYYRKHTLHALGFPKIDLGYLRIWCGCLKGPSIDHPWPANVAGKYRTACNNFL